MWPGTESNRRHEDFQSSALPTELPGHTCENIYLAGLLWRFKRSCGRAAIILRLYPALGGSRRVEHQIWASNIKFWDERDPSPFVAPRSQNSVHHLSKP